MTRRKLTLVDLFAGSGGMTRGFVAEGYRPIGAVETDVAAAATYAANFGASHVFCGDIAAWQLDELPPVDVVLGGPPCQGFSSLGKANARDPRNRLWRDFVNVVVQLRPAAFVLENVERFLTSRQFALLRRETASGTLRGYELESKLLNAADFGVPQKRVRAVVIGSRVGTLAFPTPTHDRNAAQDRRPWVTVREALKGLALYPETDRLPSVSHLAFGFRVPGPYKEHELHITRSYEPVSQRRFTFVPPGGNRLSLPRELMPPCWRDNDDTARDVMGRLTWDAPALTIRTEFFKPEKGRYLHPQWMPDKPSLQVNRAITHAEAARLQGYDDSHVWCGSKTEIARQIGNAVPPPLASAIARSLRGQLRNAH